MADGASEIDIVISRCHAIQGDWEAVYKEVKECRQACGSAHLKTIIATGELGSLENVYKASMVSMMAGSDFIKTSTGKEGVNAIFPVALVMVRCIREYLKVLASYVFTMFVLALQQGVSQVTKQRYYDCDKSFNNDENSPTTSVLSCVSITREMKDFSTDTHQIMILRCILNFERSRI